MTIYDDELQRTLVAKLEEKGIHFQVDENVIWYTIDDKDVVVTLFDELMAERENTFTFYELGYAETFVKALESSGITAQLLPQSGSEFRVVVRPEERKEANRIMAEVVFPNSEYRGVADAP